MQTGHKASFGLTIGFSIFPSQNSELTETAGPTTLPESIIKFLVLCTMRSTVVKSRFLRALLSVWLGLFFCVPAQASELHGKDGSVILRMCKSADKVTALSVMCHSYLDGYIDAAHHYGKGKVAFCLDAHDRSVAPQALAEWIDAHPESLTQPAAEVMQKALAERFPCKGRT